MKNAAENIGRKLEMSRNGPMRNKDGPAVLYQAQCNVKDGQHECQNDSVASSKHSRLHTDMLEIAKESRVDKTAY
jgi:hypothetical protein